MGHRRRIYTEDKAKVVSAVWRAEFIPFLAVLAVLHQDDMKKRMISSYSSIVLHGGNKLAWQGIE